MAESFIKLIRSDEVRDLVRKYPNAFILLTFIADRARRENGRSDGLIIGDAIIGSSDLEPGLSRQNFRTALNKLIEFGYVKIVHNGKRFFEREKSTIKLTIKSMLVNITSSKIYDINSEEPNHQSNQQLTNSQPTANHKQEVISISNDIDIDIARTAPQPRSKDSLLFNSISLQFEGISDHDRESWKTIYPHIDINAEVLKATEWLKSNPSKSHKKQWRKFLTGWFGRANDWKENKKAFQNAGGQVGVDRRTKDIDGKPVDNQYQGRF